MSSTNDIVNAPGNAWDHARMQSVRSTTATTTGADYSGVFQASFRTRLSDIFQRGLAGEFEANGSGAPSLSDADIDAPTVEAATAQREAKLAQRVSDSVARLQTLDSRLNAECEEANTLPPTWEGSWDPRTFRPKSAEEAEAFAQRMAVDTATAAAALEVVKTQLDAATLEASTTGGPRAAQEVARLTAKMTSQIAYFQDLAAIVERVTGGALSEAGEDVTLGKSARATGDLSGSEIAQELRKRGLSADRIEQMLGAGELAYEDATDPQSHNTVQLAERISSGLGEYFRDLDRHATARREQARKDAEQQRLDDKRVEKKRIERKASDERVAEHREVARLIEQRAAQTRAQNEYTLALLEAAARERRALAHA